MFAALLLLAAADPAGAPSRERMTEVLYEADNICRFLSSRLPDSPPCIEIPRRRLRELRCIAEPGAENPRLLCRFSGVRAMTPGGSEAPFGPECLYLEKVDTARWRILAFPDADVCEFD